MNKKKKNAQFETTVKAGFSTNNEKRLNMILKTIEIN